MPIRAENDPRFSRRFLFMGIIAIGFALYCLYDGVVGYPARRDRGFAEFKAENPKIQAANAAEFEAQADKKDREAWARFAHDSEVPTGPDIVTQFVMAVIAGVAGLVLLSIPMRARGRWIELDESGLRSSWGQSFEFGQVESLNKRKWRDKGIAKITYRDGARKRQFVLDDLKFQREPTDAVLLELEHRIGLEKITGGPPEALEDRLDDAADIAHSTSPSDPA